MAGRKCCSTTAPAFRALPGALSRRKTAAGYVERLRADIADGRWDEKYGALRDQPEFTGSLYLVVARNS